MASNNIVILLLYRIFTFGTKIMEFGNLEIKFKWNSEPYSANSLNFFNSPVLLVDLKVNFILNTTLNV